MATTSRILLAALALMTAAVPATALTRFTDDNPFFRRSAIGGYYGAGLPVGEFESARIGDGNHDPSQVDWGVDIEHYFGRSWSMGLFLNNATYPDRDDPVFETHVSNFGGFFRYVLNTRGGFHPFIRGGVGGERVQFQDPDVRFSSDTAWMVQGGGGLMLMPLNHLSLNIQALFNHGFTENTLLPDAGAPPDEYYVVGFNTKYWSFGAGISIYFR